MARYFKKRTENRGLPPGALVFIGSKKVDKPTVEYIAYNAQTLSKSEFIKAENVPRNDPETKQWYNITGLDNVGFMEDLRQRLNIHALAMEDVMNTGQRAKFDEFEEHLFLTLKMLHFDEKENRVVPEQISFILKKTMLITFQEEPGDTFSPIRKRIKNKEGNLRKLGPDYLAYALLDSIVDNYIYLIENLGEKIDDLELKVLEDPNDDALQLINLYKRELHFVLKVVKPVKELMFNLLRSQTQFIRQGEVMPFFKDLNGLVTHAIESVETYRVVLNDYLQIYHSNMSARMNDIMKVLTIFTTIFIPLSFFAGVYGTNFKYFPELEYRYSYYIFWGVVVLIAVAMLLFFKRRGWL
ncbi:MAG: magnesium/cobalt transporter CorA [Owenweeksia sp.]|nr:magnesium/cobalt transporter CorA [Owenweeksia sp.]